MVNYDKNSFLSGIALGRQLKGWSTADRRVQRDALAAVTLAVVPVVPVTAGTVPGAYGGEIGVLGVLHFGELLELGVSAAVTAGGLSDALTAGVTVTGVNAYGITAAGLTGGIGGSIAAEITLEVDD